LARGASRYSCGKGQYFLAFQSQDDEATKFGSTSKPQAAQPNKLAAILKVKKKKREVLELH
jgi:hypothetical protein